MNAASSTGNPASAWALLIHFGRNMWDEARCASPQHLKGFLIAPWGAVGRARAATSTCRRWISSGIAFPPESRLSELSPCAK